MNVSIYNTKVYKNYIPLVGQKNKPNSNPIKPNFKKAQMNVSSLITKDYGKKDDFSVQINKPNFRNGQNERKLNFNKRLQKKRFFAAQKTNPIQTQFKPCPERIEFTLSVIEGNGPISSKAKMLAGKSGYTLLWIYLILFLTPPGQTVRVPPSDLNLLHYH